MLGYFMMAMLCLVVVKTALRCAHHVHHADPIDFSQARSS
jgi:hypothetical protein